MKNLTGNKYDIKAFRLVKHGMSDISAYCRHCKWSCNENNAKSQARRHAKSELHTVDIYQENHTEYTSYIKERSNHNAY